MPSALERTVHSLLSRRVPTFGFSSIGLLSYIRDADACKQLINVDGRGEGGMWKFTCILGIRFDEIESLLRPHGTDESHPTVACPIHLLRPERDYYEWEGGDKKELDVAVDSMLDEIHDVGLAFFDRFCTIDAVETELFPSRPSDHLILSPLQRIATLAAIAMLRDDAPAAASVIADAMKDSRNQSPGRVRTLEELHARLFGRQ